MRSAILLMIACAGMAGSGISFAAAPDELGLGPSSQAVVPSQAVAPTQADAATQPNDITEALAPPPDFYPRLRKWGGTISANIPHPIFAELEYRSNTRWSLGLGAGGIALNNLKLGEIPIKLALTAIDTRMRWHPFDGAFYLGLALGAQTLSGEASKTIPVTVPVNGTPQTFQIDTSVKAQISGAYLTPHLGWFWIFRTGFVLGFDLGIQLPAQPKTTIEIATNNNVANIAIDVIQQTEQYKTLQAQVEEAGNRIGKVPLPYVTMLRLGWMF